MIPLPAFLFGRFRISRACRPKKTPWAAQCLSGLMRTAGGQLTNSGDGMSTHLILTRIRTVLIVVALSLVWTVAIPGVTAHWGRVFYPADLEAKFPAHSAVMRGR